ncbi:MAG TPA: hypothetical protein VJ978_16275 [Nitriliruptoraceae bacterium]|nr:hypothetical protein [Nitriliruptoraceae bacterium]
MEVYVVDAHAAVALAGRGYDPGEERQIFAPTLLRSQALAICRAGVVDGSMDPNEALELAEGACRLPRRLLGDAVLRRTAWNLANEHGWADTFHAEYIALTRLHGIALVAGSDAMHHIAAPLVRTMTVDALAGEA